MAGKRDGRAAGARWRVASALALLLALLASAAGTPGPVGADTLTVTNGNDSGPGSLRQAIADAAPGDTITFAPAVTTVTLTSEDLFVTSSVTIQGSGVGGVTIRRSAAGGTPEFRILTMFNFTEDPVTVTLQGLTFTNGRISGGLAGGGLFSYGIDLHLSDSLLTENHALGNDGGGLYYGNGTLTLTNTTISDNSTGTNGGGLYLFAATTELTTTIISDNTANVAGGGIYQEDGTLFATESTVQDNVATTTGGGGLKLDAGTVTLNGSAVSSNHAPSGNGGGIYQGGGTLALNGSLVYGNSASEEDGSGGGGLYLGGGTATLTNSTVSGNDTFSQFGSPAGGGIYNNGGTLALRFVTLTNNLAGSGGGIYNNGGTTLFGSIVTDNIEVGGGGADCGGTVTTLGYNVVGGDGGCPATGTNDLAYSGPVGDVLSPSLLDNGGPTQTIALPLNSPAVNRVPFDQCADANGVDQRGVVRPQGPDCDSGAFERNYYTLISGPPLFLAEFPAGTVLALTPLPDPGQTFVGWTVDGVNKGWADPLTITMDADHTVEATYVTTKTFADVPSNRPDYEAIVTLATRGSILGYNATTYGPDDGVQRAQMAALIARATPAGPGTPTFGYVPCTMADTWDCEDWGNTFTDQGGIVTSLWRNAGTLQHYQVAFGYTANDCANQGKTFPCYGPTDPVSHAQTIAFITRAMVKKGYWLEQPNAPLPDPGVPGVLATEAKTFAYYTGGLPALPQGKTWNDGATRGWFAEALWAALNSYWGTDDNLPDGNPAGGNVP